MKLEFDARPLPQPGHADLLEGEVDVWLGRLDLAREPAGRDVSILSGDEIARAGRMAAPQGRRMVAARCFLRRLLAAYLGTQPARIAFSYGHHGKPGLKETRSPGGLHFNVSHTADYAIVAVGLARLGVDIEARRVLRAPTAFADRFFAPGEARAVRDVPPASRADAVLRHWTRKEAYAKAVGSGIALGFQGFEVAADHGETALLGPEGLPAADWTVRDLLPRDGLFGALAVNQPDCLLLCWQAEPAAGHRGSS